MQNSTEIQYRTLFEHTPTGVFLFDRDLRVTDCNPFFLRVLQTTRARIVGLDLRTLRDAALVPLLERAIAGEMSEYEGPYQATTSDVRLVISKVLDRGGDDRAVLVHLTRALDAAIQLAAGRFEGRARVVRDYREAPIVEANESRLGLVFLDLLLHAAREPGRKEGDRMIRVALGTDAAGRAVIEFTDDGPGLAPELLGCAFDPFVGAQSAGSYPGRPPRPAALALSASEALVASLGGTIGVESGPGSGTVVRVVLPPYVPK